MLTSPILFKNDKLASAECIKQSHILYFSGLYCGRYRNFSHTLLNLSSSYKQILPAFNKITSLCDLRLFEAVGHELSELCAKDEKQ